MDRFENEIISQVNLINSNKTLKHQTSSVNGHKNK